MTFDEVEAAVKSAKTSIAVVDANVGAMVRLSAGHLRGVQLTWPTVDALRALKRELRDFDIRTGCWK